MEQAMHNIRVEDRLHVMPKDEFDLHAIISPCACRLMLMGALSQLTIIGVGKVVTIMAVAGIVWFVLA
jgi:hypothetical protein